MRLRSISAQAFRGFRDRVEVILEGDAALVHGENGSGKTSLAEAFEWALYGTVARKTKSPTPGEYSGWSWLRSAHAADDIPTVVQVQLVDAGGRIGTFTRTLDGRGDRLTIEPPDFQARLSSPRPMLAQCEIQALIQSEQSERWRELSSLLGFGGLGAMRRRLQDMRNSSDRNTGVMAVRTTASRVVQPLVRDGADPLTIDPEELRTRAARFLGLDDGASWATIEARASSETAELLQMHPRPAAMQRLMTPRVDLVTVAASLRADVALVVSETVEHRAWHRENRLSEFLALGLDLVDPTAPTMCPFCAARTLTSRTMGRLQQTSLVVPRPADHRAQVREAVRDALAVSGPIDTDVLASLAVAIPNERPISALRAMAAEQEGLRGRQSRLGALLEGFLASTESARVDAADDEAVRNLGDQIVELATAVSLQSDELRARADEARLTLEAALSEMTPERKDRLARLQVASNLVGDIVSVQRAWRVREAQAAVSALIEQLDTIEKRKMSEALTTLSADVARHYAALSPGHHIRISGIRSCP